MDRSWSLNEKGHSLLELSLSLPLMILLTFSLVSLFLWTMQLFLYELAEWTLQDELCCVMERIVGDARVADDLRISHLTHNDAGRPYCSIVLWKPKCWPDTEKITAVYFAQQPQQTVASPWKIYHSTDREPITGDNMFGGTMIQKFYCEFIPPARLRIEIRGIVPIAYALGIPIRKHSLELKTEIFLPEMMKHAKPAPPSVEN